MAKKSKRNRGPRPGSDRAERMDARKARQAAALAAPARPLRELPGAECDLVAMRAFIASASAQVRWAEGFSAANEADFATILPGAGPALVRSRDAAIWGERGATAGDADGKVTQGIVALQTDPEPADLAGSLAAALTWAAQAEPGSEYRPVPAAGSLAEIVDPQARLEVVVYNDFTWWFGDDAEVSPQVQAMFERANETIMPTARLTPESGVGAPWWVDAGDRAHLRWVRPEDEEQLMKAMARLHAAGRLTMGEGSRFAGSFRTHGLVVPVFDLDAEMHHEEWYPGLDRLDEWFGEALADESELTAAERSSRAGIIGRQVTLR
ncbi:hypothetical protein GOHSU_56_00030 [Gordonia hirsuta DSM 44140 = NBRC 16056]|uniref:DUF5926 domain-containing protein n=1 Tax=Gordonia hirsuta DSM 44140 = NBRC 16056 TaxID=1121927 RepID=L7LCL3_9ACTN|nr:DUF5926 family protein [Gordonia hirsuta]GAC58870.1 hypothetical protein GOHSU_56_00030 [Gordonia hirsuta DSM 44140 = NBRC 16056]